AGIRDHRYLWPEYPGRGVVPFVLDPSVGAYDTRVPHLDNLNADDD
ncbi:hypothetical protein NPIL_103791, partial [Nephila pilipes]